VALAAGLFGAEPPRPRSAEEALAGLALGLVRERLVALATERCMALGAAADEAPLLRTGFEITTRMLEAALAVGSPTVLDGQIAWSYERHPHDGVTPGQLLARLTSYAAVIRELLPPPDGSIVGRYVEHLIACQRRVMGRG
jgi:hypothetical protein